MNQREIYLCLVIVKCQSEYVSGVSGTKTCAHQNMLKRLQQHVSCNLGLNVTVVVYPVLHTYNPVTTRGGVVLSGAISATRHIP